MPPPEPPADGRRPPSTADLVIAEARQLVDERGLVSVGALVAALVAKGQSVRSAQASIEMLAGRRLAVVREPTAARSHPEHEPRIGGSPWVSTRILAPRSTRPSTSGGATA